MKIVCKMILVYFSLISIALAFSSPIECYKKASGTLGAVLSEESAAFLCSGTNTHDSAPGLYDPIDCYRKATLFGLNISEKNAIILCQGARSLTPVDCFREAFSFLGAIAEKNAAILCKEK